jgi:type IV secretion system protein VirB4
MLALKEFRSKLKGLPDLLNYAVLVDDGVILNKDGSFLSGFYFAGDDLDSATDQELNAMCSQINAALLRFGTGWMLNVDSIRISAMGYVPRKNCHFPDPVTMVIDEERRHQYEEEGAHFENVYTLTLTYLPPPEIERKFSAIFVDSDNKKKERADQGAIVEQFKVSVADIMGGLSNRLRIVPMNSEKLLTYLHTAISTANHSVRVPDVPMYLDALLGSRDFFAGLSPRIGSEHLKMISISGFPAESSPGILDRLNRLNIPYRWSTRFIALDAVDAQKHLAVYRRNWFQKRHGLMGLVKSAMGGGEQAFQNQDAIKMAEDADAAWSESSEGLVRFGFHTSVIITHSTDEKEAEYRAAEIVKVLVNMGFPAFIETINAVEAYLGTLPSHGYANVRRPLMHTGNLAHLLPLTSVWPGLLGVN